MPSPKDLLHMNLHEVFSERDPERRRAAIARTYVEDVRFIDPEGEVVGRQALDGRAQKILDDAPANFVLEEDGPAYVSSDTAAMAWRFGPPGSPVVRGIDILTVRDGLVSVLHTLVSRTDA
jgi:SnoaL-like domain